ncbi:MAG TPA: hypothetical protein VFD39_02805 [Trueperaceae bacterium]|nr:hypothetical protein [Trueperaceae bacterium]
MEQDDAVKKVVNAAAAIMEDLAEAIPEPVRQDLREWQSQQDAALEAAANDGKRDLERFRTNRGDRHWRR